MYEVSATRWKNVQACLNLKLNAKKNDQGYVVRSSIIIITHLNIVGILLLGLDNVFFVDSIGMLPYCPWVHVDIEKLSVSCEDYSVNSIF